VGRLGVSWLRVVRAGIEVRARRVFAPALTRTLFTARTLAAWSSWL